VNDRTGSVSRLYTDFESLDKSPFMQELIAGTGAVLMGKHTFAMAKDPDWYAGNYEFQLPIFVVTNRPPEKLPKQTDQLKFTFVTEGLEIAVRQAQAAAGAKQVTVVGGPSLAQQLLRAGMVDELQIAVMPVLLGKGLRLFENLENLEISLDKTRVVETAARTDIWFRVIR
jgi:dihydrofolate reductase